MNVCSSGKGFGVNYQIESFNSWEVMTVGFFLIISIFLMGMVENSNFWGLFRVRTLNFFWSVN